MEKEVRDVEDDVRMFKDAFEYRLGIRLDTKIVRMSWLVEHAAWLYNDCHEVKDHKTAKERLQGGQVK